MLRGLWSADASLGVAIFHVYLVEFVADFLRCSGETPLFGLLQKKITSVNPRMRMRSAVTFDTFSTKISPERRF